MKFSVAGLFGLLVASIHGAPNPQPHQSNGLSGTLGPRQANFIEFDESTSKMYAVTFKFNTDKLSDTNWIGIWPAGHGPSNGESTEASARWEYVDDATERQTVFAPGIVSGDYEAYLFHDDGYNTLAGPATFRWNAATDTATATATKRDVRNAVSFIPTSEITLPNARVGDKYEYSVKGLLREPTGLSFSVEEESWATINDEGLLSGTPEAAGDTRISIKASTGGALSILSATIPVVDKDKKLVSELSVMTYNLWEKGEKVNDYHAKQVAFLAEANVDIVGLQETDQERTKALAEALWWWHYADGDRTGIISRYPITGKDVVDAGISVTVDLDDSKVQLWNVHLSPYPYGPYNVCFERNSTAEVIRVEKADRGREIDQALKDIKKRWDDAPVILMGDFNAPSHLDWIEETSDDHCGAGPIQWPTSDRPIEKGFKDAWREVYDDPKKDPGNTWSPIWEEQELGQEPQDRIDFIYFRKGLQVKKAATMMVGHPKLHGNHQDNQWTSDHKAVMAVFSID